MEESRYRVLTWFHDFAKVSVLRSAALYMYPAVFNNDLNLNFCKFS